jgi:hypothetical protein
MRPDGKAMMRASDSTMRRRWVWGALLATVVAATPAAAQLGKVDPDGLTEQWMREHVPEYFHRQGGDDGPRGGNDRVGPLDIPDVFGPGKVLRVGNVHMKVTNWGHNGNFFTNLSSDPAGQWPGASTISYLSTIRLAVGAVNPTATDPTAVRRVSYLFEWRPETLEPEDKIYRAYDGAINGTRYVNDDGDLANELFGCAQPPCQKIDEDFLDGRDNDGDGAIDEDYGALGQEMYSFTMWDNTIQAVNTVFNEKHVPLGLECRQRAWAYSVSGFQDFNVMEYEIFNRSGHVLDSLYVGFLVDMDAGPEELSNFFSDDFDVPTFPKGHYVVQVGGDIGQLVDPLRVQYPHSNLAVGANEDSALCPRDTIKVNGFSVIDDNGDENRTTGIASVLLIDHTIDPTEETAPRRVGWRSYRSFTAGTPFGQGGNPIVDQERYTFMSANENVDENGFITATPQDQKGDLVAWCSVGPWRNVPDGGRITVTIAFAVQRGTYPDMIDWPSQYDRYVNGGQTGAELMNLYPALKNAFDVQMAFEGIHEHREGFSTDDFKSGDFHGRETKRQVAPGAAPMYLADCRDIELGTSRIVRDVEPTWFDFDCDYCTGPWNWALGQGDARAGGLFHKNWNAEAPPPNPVANVSSGYNYTDNPNRAIIPAGDNQVRIAWDNLSELTTDPKSGWFDFRGYKVWKVADWIRPVGSSGPAEADWTLLGEYRMFRYYDSNRPIERNYQIVDGEKVCPQVYIPNYRDPVTGVREGRTVPICLDRGDLWDRQSGEIIKPDTSSGCVRDTTTGLCIRESGCIVHRSPCFTPTNRETLVKYPIGVYEYVDREVKNGFVYFYSVTAFDSTTELGRTVELNGRRAAVEAEAVVPQVSAQTGRNVWVVPNPYRGYSNIAQRPSAWDLTPNASDPTGTHIDFMGLPPGKWTIKVYTVSGDLVAELRSEDSVNESVRPTITGSDGVIRPGYNRQQDHANDGQARWNLISRNGQDIVSGIYLFTVESNEGTQRGRFVVIR